MDSYDVLIVGAGPAGLMGAIGLAGQGVKVGIVEKNRERPLRGRADGLEPRTLEILDSYGLLDSWWRHASHTVELCVWVASVNERLERILRRCNSSLGTSRFHETTMDQAVVERAMEEYLYQVCGVAVQYGTKPTSLRTDDFCETGHRRAVEVEVDRADGRSTILTDFVVGADGAHSWTRKQAGIDMLGARSSSIWGVVDTRPLTNFPDIRSRNLIHKEECGTLMIIPREHGMVRLYVQLDEEAAQAAKGDDPSATLSAAQRIMAPFAFDTKSIYWSSTYRIQQLLASSYSDSEHRIFLMGDAAHTHSPKAGMGLNMSVQDAYNLSWKLAAVINKQATPHFLATYESERRPLAACLLEFDRDFNTLFHAPLSRTTRDQYKALIIDAIDTESGDISGVSAQYIDQYILQEPAYRRQDLAAKIPLGRRIPPGLIVNHADGRAKDLHEVLPSTGQWTLCVFPGDLRISAGAAKFAKLGQELEGPGSILHAFLGPPNRSSSSILQVLTIHKSPRHEINLLDLPAVFHPWDDELGWAYDRVYTDEKAYQRPEETGRLYETWGIGEKGCVMLLRPDRHVCMITGVEEAPELCRRYLRNWFYESDRRDSLSP